MRMMRRAGDEVPCGKEERSRRWRDAEVLILRVLLFFGVDFMKKLG